MCSEVDEIMSMLWDDELKRVVRLNQKKYSWLKRKEISNSHLSAYISRKIQYNDVIFQAVTKKIEQTPEIQADTLWEILKIAVRDKKCKFDDITFMFAKISILDDSHLWQILTIALRDASCGDVSQELLELCNKCHLEPDDYNMSQIEKLEKRT
jgi:hypothetical protein